MLAAWRNSRMRRAPAASPRLSPEFCLHTTEVVLAMHGAGGAEGAARRAIESSFQQMEPMRWARDKG